MSVDDLTFVDAVIANLVSCETICEFDFNHLPILMTVGIDAKEENDRRVSQWIDVLDLIRLEVASSRPDYMPILSAAKTSKHSLLAKHHILAIYEAS